MTNLNTKPSVTKTRISESPSKQNNKQPSQIKIDVGVDRTKSSQSYFVNGFNKR